MLYTWLKIAWAFLNLLVYPFLFLLAYHGRFSVTVTVVSVSLFFLLSNACFIAIIYFQYKSRSKDPFDNRSVTEKHHE